MSVHELGPSGPPRWWPGVLDELIMTKVLALDELVERCDVDAEELERELEASPLTHPTGDGWCHLLTLCEGAVLTHTVLRPELEAGVLHADDDLLLWARLADGEGVSLSGGGRACTVWESEDSYGEPVLAGPEGWLEGLEPDDLIAIRLRGGVFEVSTTSLEATATEKLGEAIMHVVRTCSEEAMSWLGTFARLAPDHPNVTPGVPLDDLLADILDERPETFAEPLPPVGTLLLSAGMELADGYVATAGPSRPTPWNDCASCRSSCCRRLRTR